MAGCKLRSPKVSIASAEIEIHSYCISKDKMGRIRLCFFQNAAGTDVAVSRLLLSEKLGENLFKSLDKILRIVPADRDTDEMRYIA